MGRVALGAAASLGIAGILLLSPASVLAAEPTFEQATATQSFGESINVEQQVSLPSGVQRVEAFVRSTDGGGTFLAQVSNPGPGDHTLRYSNKTPPGSVMPNTLVELGFRITLADGTFIDGPPARVRYEDDRFSWKTIKGDVVRIHWYEGNDGFAQRALDIGDKAVKDAAALLGVDETVPIDFYVYADRDAFYDVIGPALQENVGGLAIPEIRTLFANIAPSEVADPWVSLVVPHELTHIVFDTATRNDYHEPPHWLNEGLADYLAIGYAPDARNNVERAARNNDLMPLQALVLRFPSTADRFSLGYDESVSAIDYLVRTYGQDALVQLIQGYAGGVADDDAFQTALGLDVAGFEAGWLADLGVSEPEPYGPKPAPPGPLPPGWNAAPEATGPPVAPPPGADIPGDTGLGTTLVIGVGVLFAIVVVLGIFVVARGLNRGDPLPAPGTWRASPSSLPPPPEGSPDAELPSDLRSDLAALDARLAPRDPAETRPAGEPGEPDRTPTDDDRLGDRP